MEIQFLQVCTAFIDSLLYRVSHKMISCCLVGKLQKMKTVIRKRRTLEEPFRLSTNLGELT